MDQSMPDTRAGSPKREWSAPALTRLPATLTAGGGFTVGDGVEDQTDVLS